MKYMLLVYQDEANAITAPEREKCYVDSAQLCRELADTGNYLGAAPLHFTSTATSVRVRDNRRVVTDGPFAESKEVLGGFWLLEAKSYEEVEGFLKDHPHLDAGSLEVRQIEEMG